MVVPEPANSHEGPEVEYVEPPDVNRVAELLYQQLFYCSWV